MKTNVTLSLSKCLLIALIILLSGCRSRKVEEHKKVEKLNEIVQNDITFENDIQTNTKIEKIKNDVSFSVEPLDPEKPSRVSYKGDTLDLYNAKVVYGNSQESEKTEQDLQNNSKYQDNTSQKTNSINKEKERKTETKSASWGLNIGIVLGIIVALILIFIHIKTNRK
ncbi:hypothetical protein JM79_2769 [Gramella sp. Hel_I_59]|nr:hypothetical protein JM79_2769 [Gramella sp. Hel_I_59]